MVGHLRLCYEHAGDQLGEALERGRIELVSWDRFVGRRGVLDGRIGRHDEGQRHLHGCYPRRELLPNRYLR